MTKQTYKLDGAHSSIDFQVKHMMISKVKGTFQAFSAELNMDVTDLTTADIKFAIQANSVKTKQDARDAHLKSADFFDVENNPTIDFVATNITKTAEDEYKMVGDLTLVGITKTISFDVEFAGQSKNPMDGSIVAGFSAAAKINRKDFGIEYNAALETGGVLIGDEIKIFVELEVIAAT